MRGGGLGGQQLNTQILCLLNPPGQEVTHILNKSSQVYVENSPASFFLLCEWVLMVVGTYGVSQVTPLLRGRIVYKLFLFYIHLLFSFEQKREIHVIFCCIFKCVIIFVFQPYSFILVHHKDPKGTHPRSLLFPSILTLLICPTYCSTFYSKLNLSIYFFIHLLYPQH